ncbi:inner kinetochore subunit wip1 [Nematostella vectensis]|uniref:inner kinetochore subunit wip1 n=1 Tax=Nematostella vectensis TaxID=45351 RepID=UPI0013905E34|nr:inner kinetochore subunit wip1 [Nematostella vectensis]
MKRRFPRTRQKAIFKKFQRDGRLAKSVDILIFLDYMLFLRKLATEANMQARQEKATVIDDNHVSVSLKNVLKSFRG